MYQNYSKFLFAFISTFVFSQVSVASSYPTAVNKRPFTLPAYTAEFGGDMKVGTTSDSLAVDYVHLNYGVTDDFQLGLSWFGFEIPKLNPTRSLNANAGYFLFATDYAASMASLEVPFHFDSQVVRNVSFAMPTVFPIVGDFSILAFYSGLLDFNFNEGVVRTSMSLPIAFCYQVDSRLALDLSSQLAKFEFSDRENSYFFNRAPLRLKGLYSVTNAFDVFASTGFDDVFNAKDTFTVTFGAQVRIGYLNG